jgi:hypothetical protein
MMEETKLYCAGEVLPPVPPERELDAEGVNEEIEKVVISLRYQRDQVEFSIAKLGTLLLKVHDNRLWEKLGHPSWGSYIGYVQDRLQIGRTQIFQYVSVAKALLPVMSEDEMASVGITKCIELKRFQNLTGKRPTPELVAHAKHSSMAELKARVFLETHGMPMEKERYFDFGGCYFSDDEREEIELAFQAACLVDPPIPEGTSDVPKKKEIMLRLAREFLSTWGDLVQEGDTL